MPTFFLNNQKGDEKSPFIRNETCVLFCATRVFRREAHQTSGTRSYLRNSVRVTHPLSCGGCGIFRSPTSYFFVSLSYFFIITLHFQPGGKSEIRVSPPPFSSREIVTWKNFEKFRGLPWIWGRGIILKSVYRSPSPSRWWNVAPSLHYSFI